MMPIHQLKKAIDNNPTCNKKFIINLINDFLEKENNCTHEMLEDTGVGYFICRGCGGHFKEEMPIKKLSQIVSEIENYKKLRREYSIKHEAAKDDEEKNLYSKLWHGANSTIIALEWVIGEQIF